MKKKSPFKIIVAITLVIVALVVVLVVLVNQNNSESLGREFDEAPSTEGQPILGDPDAPVTVVEFGDFKCPGCKTWGDRYLPQLMKDYIDDGKVKFAFVNVLFHGEESRLASLAAETVQEQSPEAYWDFHQALFDAQPAGNHEGAWVTMDKLEEIANGINAIDTEAFMEAIENNALMDELVIDSDLVSKFEIESTPTIMINNVMIEGDDTFDYDVIKQAIDEALGE
ncbi:DsbA family protein [Oceanobacillus sp. J11TS1]|uniref:DsbA family protein n=1 Tax=Oceanobacillus sp. J11TS1 TaxID=2807191 RepID=UPI001B2F5156|nr:DsbA family protein [Oceanobacillus sp. J11TS1]GIO24075.1 disulfide bond formation protein D [Oceanobacillus sp. J11TS1]